MENSSAERTGKLQGASETRWGDLLKDAPSNSTDRRVEQGVYTPWHAGNVADNDSVKRIGPSAESFVGENAATDHPDGRSDSDLDPDWNVPTDRLTPEQKRLNTKYIGKVRNLIVHPR